MSKIASTLAKFSPCDVSDALVKFGVANGGYLPNLTLRSGKSVVGPAYTVLYAPKSDPRPAVAQLYIDAIPENSVLVMGLPVAQQLETAPYVSVNNALYGGLMSTRASYRKAAGSVVLGRIRDLAEHRALDYPVFLYGVGLAAPGPVVKVVGINVELSVRVAGGEVMVVRPGDYIIGDENGVVRLPVGHEKGPEKEVNVDEVLEYIPKRVAADEKVAADIRGGRDAAAAQKYWRSKI